MHASLNLNEPAFCGKASSDRVNYGVFVLSNIDRLFRIVSQICEIWVDINNPKMVPIFANLCCLEANSLNAHTTCLAIK